MATYDLDTIAAVFRLHPRTILKFMCPKEVWNAANRKRLFDAEDIVIAFGLSEAHFARCARGKDELLSTKQVAELLDLPCSVVRDRAYPVCVSEPYRFLKSAVMRVHLDRYANRPYKPRKPKE